MTAALPKGQTNKFQRVLDGAVRAFAQHGFSRTQMADIAQESGVAFGTLYRYAPSKEALFHMALLFGAGAGEREIVAARSDGKLFETVSTFLESLHLPKRIIEIETLAREANDPVTACFGSFYDLVDRLHPTFRILDRSSRAWPELAALFAARARAPALEATERFLREAHARGSIRAIGDTATTARLILEMITWFAMHRRYTPDASNVSDRQAREAVLNFVAAALRPLV